MEEARLDTSGEQKNDERRFPPGGPRRCRQQQRPNDDVPRRERNRSGAFFRNDNYPRANGELFPKREKERNDKSRR